MNTQSNANEFAGIGLALGVVTGVRSFRVDKLGRLTGVTYPQIWMPEENVAKCLRDDTFAGLQLSMRNLTHQYIYGTNPLLSPQPIEFEVAPVEERKDTMETCAHGFYAYYDGSDDYHQRGYVTGVVEGYGETLIGTRGFRCMKARIVALRISKKVPEPLRTLVARNYSSIPQFVKFEDMVAEFPPDAGGMEVTPASDPDFWKRSI